ncbi:MAG TPA: hypothetical protein DHV31_03415 [Clostridiales bacterium]|nr:hypothetical protein [Clostridiales bacterium]
MKGENTMGVKKKIIIGVSIFLAFAIMIAAIVLFGPLPMHVDWDSIYNIGSNVKVLDVCDEHNTTGSVSLAKYNADGTIDTSDWKVLQFTDMHLSETNEGDLGNNRTIREYIAAIEREEPDLVLLTGDIITSIRGRARAVQLCEIMEKLGVYWVYVLGNHEGDEFFKMSREELMSIVEKYPHCLTDTSVKKTESGEKVWGIGNFVVNLLGENYKVVQSMIFMDSGNEISESDYNRLKNDTPGLESDSYDFLKDSQKTWYKEQVNKVTENCTNGVKTMLFIHIPLIEQRNLRYVAFSDLPEGWTTEVAGDGWTYVEGSEAKNHDGVVVGKNAVNSIDGWNVVPGTINHEGVCSSDYNNDMYELMMSLRDGINALYCGHDHTNDSILYQDAAPGKTPVYLAYGRCSGYATYHLYKQNKTDDPKNLMKGYSVIEIHSDCTFDYTGVSYDYAYARTQYLVNSLPVA